VATPPPDLVPDQIAAAFLRCAPDKGTYDMGLAGGIGFDRRGVLAAMLAGLALAGCESSGEESGETVAATRIEGALEKPNLKLGFIKLTDIAPLVIAKEKGFFADEGLNVTLEPQANWKVLLDGVTGGELDARTCSPARCWLRARASAPR
jgi:ABC-type nitrate/sulfonate/bicarbonate transport system substrate-binding protein